MSKHKYESWLNELTIPDDDLESNGGRVPDDANYGSWIRRNDPVMFNVGYREFCENIKWRKENE